MSPNLLGILLILVHFLHIDQIVPIDPMFHQILVAHQIQLEQHHQVWQFNLLLQIEQHY